MKGKAFSTPSNHVEWVNGFKSNMPDWTTARHCALAERLLWWAKEARTVLGAISRPGAFTDEYDREKYTTVMLGLMEVIGECDGLGPVETVSKPMPKPPGF